MFRYYQDQGCHQHDTLLPNMRKSHQNSINVDFFFTLCPGIRIDLRRSNEIEEHCCILSMIFFLVIYIIVYCLGPLLSTWFNFSPGLDKQLNPLQSEGWNYLFIRRLQRCNSWSLGNNKQLPPTLHQVCDYLPILGLKLIHVSKSGLRSPILMPGKLF